MASPWCGKVAARPCKHGGWKMPRPSCRNLSLDSSSTEIKRRDVRSDDADRGIEKPKRRGCNNEHVDLGNVRQVVAQKATPSRGGDLGPPRQVSSDRGLADRSPWMRGRPRAGWPGLCGGSDHGSPCSSWAIPAGAIATATRAGFLCGTLGHGCRLDQRYGVEDLRPQSVKPDPQQPVHGGEANRPGCRRRTAT
jgi:hypothetical protein